MPISTRLDPRRLLGKSRFYRQFQRWVAQEGQRSRFAKTVIGAREGERVLDIGCGPGDILPYLPPVDYFGFDANPEYIASARADYGQLGRFQCAHLGEEDLETLGEFDLAISIGVLHHLDDEEARALFALARAALKPGGRLVTCDGVFTPRQNPLAWLALKLDRGEYVRDADSYLELARTHFPSVEARIRTDMIRIPYTHIIMTCRA